MLDRLRSGVQMTAVVRVLGLVWIIAALIGAFPAAVSANSYNAHETLERYASDTWASFVAMTDEKTGLPTDSIHMDGTRSAQTSITNIGAYLWSTLVARELEFISHDKAIKRLKQTLSTL